MFTLKIRESGNSEWELITTPNKFGYSIKDVTNFEGRMMNGVEHKGKIAQKIVLNVTYNRDLTVELVHQLVRAFSHKYVDIMYFDVYENAEVVKQFKVGERSASIVAWNDTYKRFAPMTFELEER